MMSKVRFSLSRLASLVLAASLFWALAGSGLVPSGVASADEPAAEKAEKAKSKQGAEKAEKKADETGKEKKPAEEAKPEEEKEPAEAKEKEEPAEEEKKPAEPKTPELSGVFEARKMTEISVRPKSWATLKVLSAARHGQRVSPGQLLLALDLETIDQAISDLRAAHRLSDLALAQAEIGMKELESKTPLSQAVVDRTRRNAKEDYEYYTKVSRPRELETLAYSLKSSERRLQYQEEELRQLEEMYKADEVTEETEEIILTRARNSVETARFMHENAKMAYEKALKYDVPRMDEGKKDARAQAEIAWQTARGSLPIALKKQKLELAKLKVDRERSDEKLDKLLADRAAMVVKAPVGGIVYYGQCDRGNWSSASTMAKKLRPSGSITPNEVVMTVVQDRPVFVRSTLDEKDLSKIHVGDKCTVVPTALPDTELPAVVREIGNVPIDAGKFDITVNLASGKLPESVVPGMTCKVKFAAAEK